MIRCAAGRLALGMFLTTLVAGLARGGELVADSFRSSALGRDYRMQVYLPDGYKDKPGPYPVAYLLHGASGDEFDWPVKGGVKETLDGLIKRGQIRPAVVVMPGNGPSWWVDGAVDKAETALLDDLLPYVEGKYRIARERSQRMIGGLSMGGYGALNLSLKHPDLFCGAAIISPAIYDPLPPETSASRRTPQFVRKGQFDAELWKSLNYPAHLEAYRKAPQKVAMWIVSGDHDALGIALMSAHLFSRILPLQPRHAELRVIDGEHEWMVFRDALPDALRYIDGQCARSA